MINKKIRDNVTDQLCYAILSLNTLEECYQFFEDICTIGELRSMAQRLDVARMLGIHMMKLFLKLEQVRQQLVA